MTITFGKWRLVPLDRRNWRLCEFRRKRRAEDGEPTWVPLDEFFQSLGAALARVSEYEAREASGDYGLGEAIERYEEIAESLKHTGVEP